MKNSGLKLGLIIFGAGTLLLAGKARCEDIRFESVFSSTDAIIMRSAQEVYEATFSKDFDEVIEDAAEKVAVFSLEESDIISWEESGQGKYVYFTLSGDKSAEIAALTKDNIGKPLQIYIGDHFVLVPQITEGLSQAGGFVLMPGKDGSEALMHSLLKMSKKVPNTTAITIAPAVIEVKEVSKPVRVKAPEDQSGPADSVP